MKDVNIETVVVDALYIVGYLIPDENQVSINRTFDDFRENKINFIAPPLLHYEVTNGIKMAVVRKRIEYTLGVKLINDFFALGIDLEEINLADCFTIAYNHGISVYDSCYIWLAKLLNIPLLTLDKRLASLART